ncbi:MAG: gliding motility-associated C-terminal domain-containing protein [Saprospiraceae bacterium]|nr:gliding motility-associated C-terminal domain-containing protein [Saprospiraceae bacterium]
MKITTLLITIFLCSFFCASAQTTIYEEDFESYADGTTAAGKWTAAGTDCDDGALNNGGNRFGVYGGQFVVEDVEGAPCCAPGGSGRNTWTSQNINISAFSCVSISLEIGGGGDLETDFPAGPSFACDNSHDQVVIEYILDGVTTRMGYVNGPDGLGGFSVDGLDGNSLRIRITLGNKANDEFYTIDNVVVSGSAITPPNITGPNTVCPGGTPITLNATGGSGGFVSYEWSNGDSGPSISVDQPGTYIVTVTNAAGCSVASNPKIVGTSTPPTVNITGPTSVCSSGGSITLDAGAGFTSYEWSTGQTSRTISVNSSDTYSVTVTNAAGCNGQDDHVVDINIRPELDNPGTLEGCGFVTLPEISGVDLSGDEGYYSGANRGGTRYNPGDDITSTRTIFIFAGTTGCSDQETFQVQITPTPNVFNINNVTACNSYTLPAVPGTNLTANRAYYTEPDANGTRFEQGAVITSSRTLYAYAGSVDCYDQSMFTITIVPAVQVNDLQDQSACASFTLPAITGTNLTGNQAYYTAPNGGGTRYLPGQAITNTQTLYIYDRNAGCSDEESVLITITTGPQINDIADTTVCTAFTLPIISGANLSGNQAYYTAPNGGGAPLNPGDMITTSQTLYIYDTDGSCSDEESFVISIATTPDIAPLTDPTACSFYILPSITGTNLSGGQAFYTQANGSGTRYAAGDTIFTTVSLFAYDGAVGCSDEEIININIISPPILDNIGNQTACQFYTLPNITGINLSGNQAYYTAPNGGGTRLNPGENITVTTTLYLFDDNGICKDEEIFTVTINAVPMLDSIPAQVGCGFFVLPAIIGSNLSGNQAYFSQANGAGTRFNPGDTIRTNTTLYAFDDNGACTAQRSFAITLNTPPAVTVNVRGVTCNGMNNGAIELVVLGNAPFTFNWDVDSLDGQQNVAGLPAGTYNVTITDNQACSNVVQAVIARPEMLDLTCSQLMGVSAAGLSDGQAQIIVTGGTAAYNIFWTGPINGTQTLAIADTVILSNLPAGSYEVTITDRNNCTTTCNFAINVEGCDISLSLAGTNATCPNTADGAIQSTITGGVAPFTFDWSVDSLDGIEDPIGLAPGNYILNVVDANNCIVTENIEIASLSPLPTATLSPGGAVCEDDCFTLNANFTGTPTFTLNYEFDFGNGSQTQTISTNNLSDSIQICPSLLGLTDGTVSIQLISIADANCQATLSQTEALTINSISRDTIAMTLCENDTIEVNGVNYHRLKPSGTETIIGGSANGCDSIIVVRLDFYPPAVFDLEQTLCEGDSIVVNGVIYNQNNPSGSEVLAGAAANGCDSTVNINLSFFPPVVLDLTQTLCDRESLTVNGVVYDQSNPSGTEILSGAAANGCDSTINVNLSFFPLAVFDLDQTLCEGDSIVINGVTYNQNNSSGTETLPGASTTGCDSIVNINLTFLTTPTFDLTQTLCDGESITVNGIVYDQSNPSGTEILSGVAANGCDSIVNVNLSFFPLAIFDLNETLCEGDSVVINGITYNQNNSSGTEILTGASATGCDSTININLAYIFPSRTVINDTLCPGESLMVNGVAYDATNPSGIETIMGGSANGCDSLIEVNLQFFEPAIFDFTDILCEDESVTINGTVYDQSNPSGTEILVGASVNGCDSIVNITLNFYFPAESTLTQTLCDGESIIVNGGVYDQSNPTGTEILANASSNGCDSIVNINLSFFPPSIFDLEQTLCEGDSIVINGVTYNQNNPSGTEVLMNASSNGCDSTVNINLIYIFPSTRTIDTSLCFGESLIVNGNIYNNANPAGMEIITGGASNGCDSIVQINLRFADEITAAVEGDATICAGDSTTLTFQFMGAQSFDIRYTDGTNSATELRGIIDGHTVQVSPTATSTYSIELIAVNGATCPASIIGGATVQVSNLAANATTVSNFGGFGVSCAGASDGAVIANAANGIAPFQYTWNTGVTTQQLTGIGAGTYMVTITDIAGCTAEGSITLTEPQLIAVTNSTRDLLCANDRSGAIIIDNITGGAGPYEVSLNGTSFRAINDFPYELGNLAAGNYSFIIRDANDCEVELSSNITSISNPTIDLGDNITVSLGDSVEIEGISNFTPNKVEWTPTIYLSSPDMLRTFVKPIETTIYEVTASDTSGCLATDRITIFVNKERGVFVPTAFSPDGDGNNDLFYIYGGNDVVRIKKFIVFDRWGNLLYERGEFLPNDPQYGWNGKFNGRDVALGVYVYYAEIEFIDGFTEVFKGDIAVIR